MKIIDMPFLWYEFNQNRKFCNIEYFDVKLNDGIDGLSNTHRRTTAVRNSTN